MTVVKARLLPWPDSGSMDTTLPFSAELLRRYDRPGPRYTSYPTAPQFDAGFGEAELRAAAEASNGDPIPRPLSLYVHIPYCVSPCFYCGCNRIITRDKSRSGPYLARLYREIALAAELFDRDREVIQLHFGGGTPNFLSPAQLREVVDTLRRHFLFSGSRERDLNGLRRLGAGGWRLEPEVLHTVRRPLSAAHPESQRSWRASRTSSRVFRGIHAACWRLRGRVDAPSACRASERR